MIHASLDESYDLRWDGISDDESEPGETWQIRPSPTIGESPYLTSFQGEAEPLRSCEDPFDAECAKEVAWTSGITASFRFIDHSWRS
jgi:hypothetical protein